MANEYDFYKPNLASEYPIVDGPLSVTTYVGALDAAYTTFKQKLARAAKCQTRIDENSVTPFSLDDVDFALFHSPYGKQAVKGHARMYFNDFVSNPSDPRFSHIPNAQTFLELPNAISLVDKSTEKTFVALSKESFETKTDPAMACSRRLGNMYTASLYCCLASLLGTVEPSKLLGKRISFFSFGGGCAASFFTARFKGDTTYFKEALNLLERFAAMTVSPPRDFAAALAVSQIHPMLFDDSDVALIGSGEESQSSGF